MSNTNQRIRLGIGAAALACALAFAAPASASTVSLDGDSLRIDGENDSDQITVSTNGTTLTVVDTGVGGATNGGAPCASVNATTVTCPADPPGDVVIDRFEVQLENGVDSFTNTNFVTDDGHVHSGSGTGAKTVAGGPGSQEIDGGSGDDNLSGGEGDDSLFDGGRGSGAPVPTGGNDLLDGGPGSDSTTYSRSGPTPLSLSFDGVANDGYPGETDNLVSIENASGGDGNDTLVGDASANQLSGNQGDDVVSGLGGNDSLFGDFPSGGLMALRGLVGTVEANDTLIGGPGRDGLDCGEGPDIGIRDPLDDVRVNCERIGADVTGDSAGLSGKKKNKFKVQVACPDSEASTCAGKLVVSSNGKQIGKGKFSVAAGASKGAKAKLSKKGTKAVKRAGGSLLVSAAALTDEPGGVSESAADVLIFR